MATTFRINPTKAVDEVAAELRNVVRAATGASEESLEQSKKKVADLKNKVTDSESKATRAAITVTRLSEKISTMRAFLQDMTNKNETARRRFNDLSASAQSDRSAIQTLNTEIRRATTLMAATDDTEEYAVRATMLKGVQHLIDTSVPISYSSEKLTWRSADIHINSPAGAPLVNMGKFDVKVYIQIDNYGARQLFTECKPAGNNTIKNGYPHPHIRGSGSCCLGTAAPMLLEHLTKADVALTVTVVNEFLQHYNPDNPFHKLANWCVNPYDHGECPVCGNALLSCTCVRCPYCGGETAVVGPLRACGVCATCCAVHHVNNYRLPGLGLNRTSCFNKATLLRRTT